MGKAFCMRLNIGFVIQLFCDDGVDHRVQQRHICSRRESQAGSSIAVQGLSPRVQHKQLSPPLGGVFDKGGRDRVIHGRVCPDHDNRI